MATKIVSSLQNLKWLKIGYKYIKQPPEVVFVCCSLLHLALSSKYSLADPSLVTILCFSEILIKCAVKMGIKGNMMH